MSKKANDKCYELMANYSCNAQCLFCSQGDYDKSRIADFESLASRIYVAYKSGYRKLGLTGGEPLIRPDILKIVSMAKRVGFRFIRVQTNGIKLADGKFCDEIVKAGLTFCKFSFLSDSEKVHDRLVGAKGAWRQALAGLQNMRRHKVRIGNNILVNRYNYRRLPEILKFFIGKGITHFIVVYPCYVGNMSKNASKIGVSLPAAEKYFARAVEEMERAGLSGELLFLNVPPCFLDGREDLPIGLDPFNTLVTDVDGRRTDLDMDVNATKSFVPACRKCSLKGRCSGVDKHYPALFGDKGFRPVRDPKHEPKTDHGPFLSDNERCLVEILKLRTEVSTAEVLKLSRKIVLCRDCSDGNAVMNAAQRLVGKGYVESRFDHGRFLWRLIKSPPEGS